MTLAKIAQIVHAATIIAAAELVKKVNAIIHVTVAHAITKHAQIALTATAVTKAHAKIALTTVTTAIAMMAIIQKPKKD